MYDATSLCDSYQYETQNQQDEFKFQLTLLLVT